MPGAHHAIRANGPQPKVFRFGFFGPAGTPKPVIDGFYRHVAAAVREEANYNTFVTKFRSEVVLPPPDELRQMIVEELPFWGKIIRDNSIKSGAG